MAVGYVFGSEFHSVNSAASSMATFVLLNQLSKEAIELRWLSCLNSLHS